MHSLVLFLVLQTPKWPVLVLTKVSLDALSTHCFTDTVDSLAQLIQFKSIPTHCTTARKRSNRTSCMQLEGGSMHNMQLDEDNCRFMVYAKLRAWIMLNYKEQLNHSIHFTILYLQDQIT